MLAEEIFFVVIVFSGCDGKDFAGAFRIIAGNDRRMDIDKTLILEEFMDCHRQSRTHSENRHKGVGTRTQMRDLP